MSECIAFLNKIAHEYKYILIVQQLDYNKKIKMVWMKSNFVFKKKNWKICLFFVIMVIWPIFSTLLREVTPLHAIMCDTQILFFCEIWGKCRTIWLSFQWIIHKILWHWENHQTIEKLILKTTFPEILKGICLIYDS